MNTNQLDSLFIGFVSAVMLMALVGLVAINSVNSEWQREAIKHGAAEYDTTTGEFRWKDGK